MGNRLSNIILTLLVLVLFSLIAYNFMGHTLTVWDEALYANNAIEMTQTGDVWNYYFQNKIDHHNTKPPLVIWLQALSLLFVGNIELAIRLPSYLALMGTIIVLLFFSKKMWNNYTIGLLAGIFMLTNKMLIRKHVFLTGDLDAMLCFWITSFWLYSVYLATHFSAIFSREKYICYFGILFAAWATKSTSILLAFPSSLLAFLFFGNLKNFVWSRNFFTTGIATILIIVTYYVFRSFNNPNYFEIVWFSEFQRVYKNVQPWLDYDTWLYFNQMRFELFRPYYLMLLFGLPIYFLMPNLKDKKLSLVLLLIPLLFLLIITVPKSKMSYYSAPAFPLLCLLLSFVVCSFVALVSTVKKYNANYVFLSAVGLVGIGLIYVQTNELVNFNNKEFSELHEVEYEIHALPLFQKKGYLKDSCIFFHPITHAKFKHGLDVQQFYATAWRIDKKYQIKIDSVLQIGAIAIASQKNVIDTLNTHYNYQLIDSCQYGMLVKILSIQQ